MPVIAIKYCSLNIGISKPDPNSKVHIGFKTLLTYRVMSLIYSQSYTYLPADNIY